MSTTPRADYKRLLTEAYDLDKPSAPPVSYAFYAALCQEQGGPVLEQMSGSGRYLVPLAAAGVDIDGVDASPDMLAACRRRCAEQEVAPGLYEQLLHELVLPRRYALVFNAAGSFGLVIDRDEARESLVRTLAHLRAGGLLALDVETTACAVPPAGRWSGRSWRRPDGSRLVLRDLSLSYDETEQVHLGLGIYESFVDGTLVETELDEWAQRYWDPLELAALLTDVGFSDVRVCRQLGTEPAGHDDESVAIYARRPS
jgi:Methyltransferase domain